MNQPFPGGGLEEVRSFRRLFLLELLFSAIVLGILVGLFSGALHTYLTAGPCQVAAAWKWLKIYGGLLALALLIIVAILLRQRVVEVTGLTMLLPVQVEPQQPRAAILSHPVYQPASYGNQLFGRAGREFRARFKARWPGVNPLVENFKPGHFCWDALMNLAQALVVQLLKLYGEHSLTPSAYFKPEFRRLAGRLGKVTFNRQHWPKSLLDNPFLTTETGQDIQNLLLPKGGSLKEVYPPSLPGERHGRRNLIVTTRYGFLEISFSPNWSILSSDGRAEALKAFPSATADHTCFLLLPIELRLTVKRFYLFGEKMQYHYWWFQKLIDNLRRRMSWGYYLRGGRVTDESF